MIPADRQRLAANADLLAEILDQAEWEVKQPLRWSTYTTPGLPVPTVPKATEWQHLYHPSMSIGRTCSLAFLGIIVLGMAVSPILGL